MKDNKNDNSTNINGNRKNKRMIIAYPCADISNSQSHLHSPVYVRLLQKRVVINKSLLTLIIII